MDVALAFISLDGLRPLFGEIASMTSLGWHGHGTELFACAVQTSIAMCRSRRRMYVYSRVRSSRVVEDKTLQPRLELRNDHHSQTRPSVRYLKVR